MSAAESILGAMVEVQRLDDIQAIVDLACERVVEMGPYRLAVFAAYLDDAAYVGMAGGDEDMRASFLRTIRASSRQSRREKCHDVLARFAFPGTRVCFLPADCDVAFSPSFRESEERPGDEWHARDRLMIFPDDAEGEASGLLSLDRPDDGRRPAAHLPELRMVERFVTLVAALIRSKHLAGKLRESEQRYAAVVEQGSTGVLVERAGAIVFANRRIAEMAGVSEERIVGRPVAEFLDRKTRAAGLDAEREGRLLRPEGGWCEVAWREAPIRVGGAEATLVSVEDVTERKRMFGQLLRAQKMDSVGTLASGMAHDFNNLLSEVLGYASLLQGRLEPGSALYRYVRGIEQAADRAASMTRQLLGLVRDEQVEVAPVDVAELLAEMERFLAATLPASCAVRVRCDPHLPLVKGSANQLHQVLLNVCLNARDAMPDGGTLTLEAEPAGRESGKPYVRLAVRDTGCGMDAETLGKVFDPFFTSKPAGRGTGLGLYMAYRVVERHGGTIDIASEPGRGTIVEIFLPAEEEAAAVYVLVAGGDPVLHDVATEMIRSLGHATRAASEESDVARVARRAGRAVWALADPAAAPWVRTHFPGVPIVVCSDREPRIAGVRFLRKPFKLQDLRRAVETAPSAPAR